MMKVRHSLAVYRVMPGFFSNANDLAKLYQMWLNGGEYGGGERFLSRETVKLLPPAGAVSAAAGLDSTNLIRKITIQVPPAPPERPLRFTDIPDSQVPAFG